MGKNSTELVKSKLVLLNSNSFQLFIQENRVMKVSAVLRSLILNTGILSIVLIGASSSFTLIANAGTFEDQGGELRFPNPSIQFGTDLDVPYVPTPTAVVDAMLQVAKVGKDDVLYDLGSGDGRIPITAAKKFGTRGVGIDLDPNRIEEANTNAQKAGVTNRVRFMQQDLFKTDLSNATVITLYLLPSVNLELRPRLLQLKPGTRIVSHAFDMGDWKPDQTLEVNGKKVYYWVVPEKIPENLKSEK
jgi:SAM-dependent methyltransferase